MEQLGIVNQRKFIYQQHSLEINWTKNMPEKNWLCIVVVENQNNRVLAEIARKIIVNNACYVCCVGKQGKLLHDTIDEEIVFRQVDIDNLYLPSFDIITTYHTAFDDALWFAVHAAQHSQLNIETVLCLNTSHLSLKESMIKLLHPNI